MQIMLYGVLASVVHKTFDIRKRCLDTIYWLFQSACLLFNVDWTSIRLYGFSKKTSVYHSTICEYEIYCELSLKTCSHTAGIARKQGLGVYLYVDDTQIDTANLIWIWTIAIHCCMDYSYMLH